MRQKAQPIFESPTVEREFKFEIKLEFRRAFSDASQFLFSVEDYREVYRTESLSGSTRCY